MIGHHLLCDLVLLDEVVELDVLQEEVCGDLIPAQQADHQLLSFRSLFLLLATFLYIPIYLFLCDEVDRTNF